MKWWIYQRERFPIVAHGPLIAAFSASAVSYVTLLENRPIASWQVYATAFIVCLLFFLQLRIADEFKDREEDATWRPYRPVPRGLVRLEELRIVFIGAAVLQLIVSFCLSPALLGILLLGWMYLGLMSVEFFCRDWLKKRPVVYLVSHMGIMPLVDLFATACEWAPDRSSMPQGLWWFLAASFCNGVVIEVGRKLRQPQQEEEGVETYSKLWGKKGGAAVWLIALCCTYGCAWQAALLTGNPLLVIVGLAFLMLLASVFSCFYVSRNVGGAVLEKISALWTLVLYLLLGILPLLSR